MPAGLREIRLRRVAVALACATAIAPLVSIAAGQILLGLAVVALLVSGMGLRAPRAALPLALFMAATLVSLAFSEDPAAGWPQIRKFYVFLTLPVVYTALARSEYVTRLVLAWSATATASALVAMGQFVWKWREARELGAPFYAYYVGERITGFMSHWQTFGGEMMLVFLLLAAWVLFARPRGRSLYLALAAGAVLAAAIVLGFTRNIWLGSFAGGLYLLWFWKRRWIPAVPVVIAVVLAVGPDSLRDRVVSLVQPHGEVDSNQHRVVTFRTGIRMIEAHPLLGLGPEHVGVHFEEYVPDDVPRPLPEGWYGHLHNIYLHYAAERGIPAMLLLVWFLVGALRDFWRARRRAPEEERWYLHGACAAVIAVMTSGMFELNLGDTEVLTMFLAIVACGYAWIESSRRVSGDEADG